MVGSFGKSSNFNTTILASQSLVILIIYVQLRSLDAELFADRVMNYKAHLI